MRNEAPYSGETKMKIVIDVTTFLDSEHQEELEDLVRDVLKNFGVNAKLESSTGNELTV